MATYQELISAAQAAKAEGRNDAARQLAEKAVAIRRGEPSAEVTPSLSDQEGRFQELLSASEAAKAEGREGASRILAERALALRNESAAEEEDKPGVIADIGRGVVTAPVSFVQGLTELGAIGLDTAFGTNATRNVTDAFETFKEDIAPRGNAGKIAEELLVFGAGFIPIAGWLGRASAVAKGKNVGTASSAFMKSAERFGRGAGKDLLKTRAGLVGSTALGAGVYETIVSPNGRTSMADSFNFLPDELKTEADERLEGREEAFRQFRNKLRQGAEASALSAGFDAALYGVGQGVSALGTVPGVSEVTSSLARTTTTGFELLGQAIQRVPGGRNATEKFKQFFSPTQGSDPRFFEELQDAVTTSDSVTRETAKRLQEYDKVAKQAVKAIRKSGDTTMSMERAKGDFLQFLLGNRGALEPYGEEVVSAADRLLKLRSKMQDTNIAQLERVVRSAPERSQRQILAQQTLDEIQKNQKAEVGYLNRIFEMYERPSEFYKNVDITGPAFDKAVNDVTQYFARGQGADALSDPNIQQNAKDVVLEILGLESVKEGIPPNLALKNKVLKVTEDLLGRGKGLVSTETPLLKLSTDAFIGRKDLIESSPHLRALMGEIKDPEELLVTTMNKLATNAAATSVYDAASRTLTIDLYQGVQKISEGGRPLFVQVPDRVMMSPERFDAAMAPFQREAIEGVVGAQPGQKPTIETYTSILEDSGYIKLGESDAANIFGGRFGALSGMYVPKETYRAMTAPLQLNMHPISEAAAIMNQIRGMSQKQLIVPNPASRVRDFLGNAAMLAGNANLPRDLDFASAAKLYMSDLSQLDDAGLAKLKAKLELSGTQDSNLLLSAIREYLREGEGLGAAEKFRSTMDRAAQSKVAMPLTAVSGFFERLTEGVDSFFKGLAVMSEEAKLVEALRSSGFEDIQDDILQDFVSQGLAKRTSSEVIADVAGVRLSPVEVVAADIVKDTMPIYGRVGAAVRGLDRIPLFGNFTSFASENIRNSVNILNRAMREMGYRMDPELAAKLPPKQVQRFERQMRALGAQRLTGYLTVAVAAPKAMVRGSMQATGTTDEDMRRLYQLLPEYLDGHDLLITGNDGEGNIEYVDLSYVAPYGYVTDAAQAALREYSERGVLGKGEADQIASSVFNGLGALAEPFGAESIVFERVRDVLPSSGLASLGVGRGGATSTGAKVYNETDSLGDKVAQGFLHTMDSLTPAYTKLIAEAGKGEIKPGRLTRAMTETPGARGQEYDSYEELARQVTGFTPMEVDLKRDFEFSGKAYAPRRSEAKTAANRIIRAADSTPEQMVEGWENYLDALYREQSKLYNDIQAARQLRLSDAQIRRNLIQKANLGSAEVNMIMRGQFNPGMASKEVLQEVRMQVNQEQRARLTKTVPITELNRLSAERRGQPLAPAVVEREQAVAQAPAAAPTPPPQEQAQSPEAVPMFGVATQPIAPLAPQQPVAPAVPQAQPTPSPEFLGSNPIEQLRNMELFNRLRGQ